MKTQPWLKKLLLHLAIFVPTVVLLVEAQRFIKQGSDGCPSECASPKQHGLVINPFPREIVPHESETDQTNNLSTNAPVRTEAPNP